MVLVDVGCNACVRASVSVETTTRSCGRSSSAPPLEQQRPLLQNNIYSLCYRSYIQRNSGMNSTAEIPARFRWQRSPHLPCPDCSLGQNLLPDARHPFNFSTLNWSACKVPTVFLPRSLFGPRRCLSNW